MPAITLYGRRWHFSSDVVPLPAFLGACYHLTWVLIMVLGAAISGQWPHTCQSAEGRHYVTLFIAYFASFVASFIVELLLTYHGLQGAPFEVSKRKYVPLLLYLGTTPLLVQLAMAVYGAWVSTDLEPDCWPVSVRSQVTNFAQGLVFCTWGFMFVAILGLLIAYNMYPDVDEVGGWEDRCRCIARILCCHQQVVREPDGKRPPIRNIAELTAGLLSHVDLDASDLTAALVLTSAAQNRRRRLRVAKALLPVYRALKDSVETRSRAALSSAGGMSSTVPGSTAGYSDEDGESATGSLYEVPNDRELNTAITSQRSRQLALQHEGTTGAGGALGNGASAPTGGSVETAEQNADGEVESLPESSDATAGGKKRSAMKRRQTGRRPARGHGKSVSWMGEPGEVPPPEALLEQQGPAASEAAAAAAAPLGSAELGGGGAGAGGGVGRGVPGSTCHDRLFGEDCPPGGTSGDPAAAEQGQELHSAGSMPLTEENVAALERLQRMSVSSGDEHVHAAAQLVAGELLEELPDHVPEHGEDIVDQLAEAIEAEIQELGGDELAEADVTAAAVSFAKNDSLDMSSVHLDPDQPTIWFQPSSRPSNPSTSGLTPAPSGGASSAEQAAGAAGTIGGEGSSGGLETPFSSGGASGAAAPDLSAASPFAAVAAGPPGSGLAGEAPFSFGAPQGSGDALPFQTASAAAGRYAGAAATLPAGASSDTDFNDAASRQDSSASGALAGAAGATPPVSLPREATLLPSFLDDSLQQAERAGAVPPADGSAVPASPAAPAASPGTDGSASGLQQALAEGSGRPLTPEVLLEVAAGGLDNKAGECHEEEEHYGGPKDKSTAGEGGTPDAVQRAINIEVASAAALRRSRGSLASRSSRGSRGDAGSATSSGDVVIDVGGELSGFGSQLASEPSGNKAGSTAGKGHLGTTASGEVEVGPDTPPSQAAGGAPGGEEALDAAELGLGGLAIDRQITLQYPVVITPSEHVDEFRGPLPPDALADIYAGRHEKVPSEVLGEVTHLLKYSYGVYYLQPKIEHPGSCIDVMCWKPPNPTDVVFKGFNELEELAEDDNIELLHLNCSNRVLAHLPYMIALDHTRKAVVLAIRGTISVADLVTDAVLYPEPLDEWLPDEIKQEIEGPAFAHAGMVAAARAIFEDMTQRGILQPLMHEEQGGFDKPPQQQDPPNRDTSGGGGGGKSSSRGGGDTAADAGRGSHGGSSAGGSGSSRGGGGSSAQATAGSSRNGVSESGWSGKTGSSTAAEGSPGVGRQASGTSGAAGRLWEGGSGSAAIPDSPDGHSTADSNRRHGGGQVQGQQQQPEQQQQQQQDQSQQRREPSGGIKRRSEPGRLEEEERREGEEESPGRQTGSVMRRLIEEEGWQFIVQGHSLGAGAAALVSLKLREHYPGLKCIAYSVPGSTVSKNLAHAMAKFTTSVVVGKDAVPRMTVATLGRLMDEMVTALARCRQPKMKVLFYPWWRRNKRQFREMFYSYKEIPSEPLQTLRSYYESRANMGQPLNMYPPGRVIFLRPIKTRRVKEWDAVWIAPEDIIGEGILVSPHMLTDHLCSTVFEALTAATKRTEVQEANGTMVQGTVNARKLQKLWHGGKRVLRVGQGPRRGAGRRQALRRSSLTQVLIDDSM